MQLPRQAVAPLFVIGFLGAMLGDAGHVESDTTEYLKRGVPFIWHSPLWFLIGVGLATVGIADLRLRLGPAREHRPGDWYAGAAAIVAVLGIYGFSAVVRHEDLLPSTVLLYALAVGTFFAIGDGRPALICGLVAAVTGTAAEIGLVALDVARYADPIDTLAGVAPWLPALYFAFGVVAARLGEIGLTRCNPSLTPE